MCDTEEAAEPKGDELIATLRLAMVPGVGPRIRQALLERFGSPRAVLTASREMLQSVQGVGPKISRAVADADRLDVDRVIDLGRKHGIDILTEPDDRYPRMLREIHDPPGVLFVGGSLRPEDALAVGIVGTRHATPYGLRQAERLAGGLARCGMTVVSGLARGIDAAAHRGALAAGGRTVAVLANGILNVYPPEHDKLAADIMAQGAVISEAPPEAAPVAGAFPQRNRIISGLSLGVIIVEAGQRSGALITARHATEQGREVFAVPGHVDSPVARGCHRLIRDGAKLVESVDDVIEELGPLVEATPREDGQVISHPAEMQLNELEQKVLAAVGNDATSIDQIVTKSGLPVPRVLSTISVLEMRRLIRRLTGSTVTRMH